MPSRPASWNPLPPEEVGPELCVELLAEEIYDALELRQEWELLPTERFSGICRAVWSECFPSRPSPEKWMFDSGVRRLC